MVGSLVGHVLQYGVYSLEIGLLAALVWRGLWKRLPAAFLYVLTLVVVDALARPLVLHRYGLYSIQYYYVYFLTNTLLELAAFLMVCSFFRSACAREEKLWGVLKLALPLVFVLVVAISLISIRHNYSQLRHRVFISEFQQYLYFACLVLNTLLFVMMQYVELPDDLLSMLVCGTGLQFAGPAASMALVRLVAGDGYAQALLRQLEPLCTLAMLLVWLYAVRRATRAAQRPVDVGTRAVERVAA